MEPRGDVERQLGLFPLTWNHLLLWCRIFVGEPDPLGRKNALRLEKPALTELSLLHVFLLR